MTINHVVLSTGAIRRAIAEELVRDRESVRMVNRSGKMKEDSARIDALITDL